MTHDIYSAMQQRICDITWRLDLGRLLAFVVGDKSRIAKAVLFGSKPPQNDSLWKAIESKGFEVITEDRNVVNKEKELIQDLPLG
jgi:hypothetical protein